MKTAIILVMMPLLLASTAYSANSAGLGDIDIVGSKLNNIQIFSSKAGLSDIEKKLDVVGSKLDNIQIFSDNADLGNTEIVGSTLTNIKISPPANPPKKSTCEKIECYWDFSCMDYSYNKPHVSCLKSHLGVDAWYGRYWFMDEIYTPKWPRVF
jgi:hypothetical protein